jgi:beta-glucosidase
MRGVPVITKTAGTLNFKFWDDAPAEGLKDDDFSIKWKGSLTAPKTGKYLLGCFGSGYRFFLGDSLLLEYENTHESVQRFVEVPMIEGAKYPVRVDAFNKSGNCQIDFRWKVPGTDYFEEALAAARKAEIVVMVMGLSPRLEGEEMDVPVEGFKGGDRLTLELPAIQQQLLKAVYQVNPKIVLVLMNGSALSINWADEHIPAIIEAWYPGQAGGAALADVLFGDYNPSGRLPITFYKSVDDLPPFDDYNMKGHTYRYFRGTPLYPFGFGLSYSTFEYPGIEIQAEAKTGDRISVLVKVKNTGEMAGEEVVQLYLKNLSNQNEPPIVSLKGFERIFLNPGQEKKVEFTLNPRDFSIINDRSERVLLPGAFQISVGGNQPDPTNRISNKTGNVISSKLIIKGNPILMEL